MIASIILAAAIGGCPKPLPAVHHAHRKPTPAVVPLCSCVAEEPRVILLPAPTPDPEPIELNVLRYYVPLTADVDYEPPELWQDSPVPRWIEGPPGSYFVLPPAPHSRVPSPYYPPPSTVRAPEIDPSSGIVSVTMLAMFVLIVTDRRPKV